MHDDYGRIHMHCGAGQIIIVANADGIRILKFLIEQRIGIRAIAVVGGPMFRGFGGQARRTRLGDQAEDGTAGGQTESLDQWAGEVEQGFRIHGEKYRHSLSSSYLQAGLAVARV